jgi:hypothetical protein
VKPILLLVLPGGLALGLIMAAYHPVMVKLHGGTWCMKAYPDGHQEFLYGGACSR